MEGARCWPLLISTSELVCHPLTSVGTLGCMGHGSKGLAEGTVVARCSQGTVQEGAGLWPLLGLRQGKVLPRCSQGTV